MKVKIYTYSTIRSPSAKTGAIGYHMTVETSKGPQSRTSTEYVGECSCNRSALLPVLYAIRRLTAPCELEIYTDSAYVANGLENVRKWQQAGWKNSKGEDTANREEWEEVLRILETHPAEAICGKVHEYYFWLRNEVRRKLGENN